MTRFGSREVLQILDVKPHVLRYWEQILPLIRSQRDETGHRVWTAAQVRILQRLRHLVVRRGMSVHAAGETILREGESAPGNVKAGLEAVRSELVATLQRLQEGGGRSGDTDANKRSGGTGDAGNSGSTGSVAERAGTEGIPGDTGLAGRNVVDLVAEGLASPPRAAQEPLPARRDRDHPPPLSTARPLRAVRIVYRHLFAYSGHDSSVSRPVPELLRRILEMRAASSTVPIIVCAPADHVEQFRNAFASWTGPELSVAPVPMISHRGGAWMSPLLSVVIALMTDPNVAATYRVTSGRVRLSLGCGQSGRSAYADSFACRTDDSRADYDRPSHDTAHVDRRKPCASVRG